MKRFILMICAVMIVALPGLGNAGSSETAKPVLPFNDLAKFSNRVQQDLAARGAHVAIVSRMGRNPSELPQGITYTHVGFWVYSQITNADGTTGRGYRAYNLYQQADDKTRSRLVQDTPADFFAGARRLDAGVIIPDPRLQRKLLRVITSPTYAQLHNANYSVLANPNTRQFQNCTEHTLDVLMASLYSTGDRAQIKSNISAHFQPQPVRLGGVRRLLASTASGALTTVDHGASVRTATFGSIARFMKDNGLASDVYRITPSRISGF